MPDEAGIFKRLEACVAAADVETALGELAAYLREARRYDELFEVRLMESRRRLNLPIDETTRLEDLPEPQRSQMEEAYLDACREVGFAWLEAGNIKRGWTFLQPLGEPAAVAERLARIDPDEENLEPLIEVALYGGVCPALGIDLVLSHYGICNAITICQSTMHVWSPADRRAVAERLIRHLHAELSENVRADVARRFESSIEGTLAEIIDRTPRLCDDRNYHIDASHLASVVRMAEVIEEPEVLQLVVELCAYGARLDPMYHYAGDEPFADTYEAYGLFYGALLGRQVEEAIDYFRRKTVQLEDPERLAAVAVLVTLLSRLDRYSEALDAAVAGGMPVRSAAGQAVPSLLWLANRCGRYEPMLEHCRQRDDLVGFLAALVVRDEVEQPADHGTTAAD